MKRSENQTSIETPGALESPFLLGNAYEIASETEAMTFALDAPISAPTSPEFPTQKQVAPPREGENQDRLVDRVERNTWRADSRELDPYAAIRSALAPEHVDLPANEVTKILGRTPATLVLHQLLNSPVTQQVTLASLLGKHGRRSVRVDGSDLSIPAYLRLVSRLCTEVAEQSEAEFKRPLTSRNDIVDQAFDTASASVSEAEVGETDDGSSRDLEEASYITADAFVVDKDGQEYFTTFPQLGDLTVQKATILTPSNFESLMDHLLASNQKNFLIDAHGDPSGLSMHLASGTKISATKQSLFILRGIEQIQTLMRLAHESNTIWGRASGTELDRWRRIVKTLHSKTWQKMVGLTRPTETPQVSNVDAARSIVQSRLAALVDALFLGEIANKQERVDRLIKKMLQLQSRGIREIQFRACNIGKDPVTLYEFRKFFGADHLCAPDVRSGMGLVVPRIDRGAVDRLAKGRLTQLYNLPGGRFAIWIKISGAKFTAACAADTQEAVGEWVESHVMANSTYRKGTLPIHFLQTQPLVFALDKDYAAHIQCRSSLWEGAVRANELEEEEAHKDEEYEPDRSIGGDQETQTQREETFAFDSREGSDEIETEDESEVEQAWASTLEQEGAAQEQEAEDYEPPAAEWPPGIGGEQTEDFTGVDYEEGESQVLDEQPLEERFDPTAVPKDVANALGKQDWALALKLTIQAGWRDENDLTNLIFFARHPELPTEPLKQDDPNFKQLSAEWAKILDKEVWKAIKVSAENSDLVVSGEEVTDHHRSFFRGKSGKRLKKLVEDAVKEVDLNPGLLEEERGDDEGEADTYEVHLEENEFRVDLNAAIERLPDSARDNLKYVVSMHPAQLQFQVVSLTKKIVKVVPRGGFLAHVATHHQKFMVVRKSGKTIAYCGGLDISPQRTPQGWPDNKLQPANRLVWHDTHVKLEGLIARDLEREFVLRWNREKDKSTAAKLRDWKPFENLNQVPLGSADREATKNTHKLQMLRTVSAGATTPDIRRDDVWQGYFRLIGCATRFLFMENQYFHEPTMADAIVKQAEAQPDLIIIIVVAFQIDDPTNQLTEHGRAQQNEFFKRLSDRIPQERLRVYTMFGRLVHSKLILVDDQALSVGSTNADPRDFFMDTQLNVILDDPRAVKGFRHQLWSHDLGVTEAKVAGWGVSDFIAQWDLVANANNGLRTTPERMTGEAVVPFDPSKVKGKLSAIADILSEVDGGETGKNGGLGRF